MSEQNDSGAIKVIDKRGTNPGRERETMRPDLLTSVLATEDPMRFIAVFPGNRVTHQEFEVTRKEAKGFNLMKRGLKGIGPEQQRAIQAARMRCLKVIERAMAVHNGKEAGTHVAAASKVIH